MIENIPEEILIENRLPIGPRNRFQIKVFEMLGVSDMDTALVEKYSPLIKTLMDNPKNEILRAYILEENFEEAGRIVIAEINKHEQGEGLTNKAA
jgi:hypothetical protein